MRDHGGRVVLADDDVLLREELVRLLPFRLRPRRPLGNAVELLAVVREHRPALLLVNVLMPPTCPTEGLDAAG